MTRKLTPFNLQTAFDEGFGGKASVRSVKRRDVGEVVTQMTAER